MPKITGKSNVLNRKRNTLQGHKGIENASMVVGAGSTSSGVINIYELTQTVSAGETIIAGDPVNITSGVAYVASNLLIDNKPCHGIAVSGGDSGSFIKVQIGGLLIASLGFTANKDVFLRASGLSHVPLVANSVSEDCNQRFGRALTDSMLLIDIEQLVQLR